MRNSKLNVDVGDCGNGGNAGAPGATNYGADGYVEYNLSGTNDSNKGSGICGFGGQLLVSGLKRWTPDCVLDISIGHSGKTGSDLFQASKQIPTSGHYSHPDGSDGITIYSDPYGVQQYTSYPATAGYYTGKGGNGAAGGDGIPIDGYRNPGSGGVALGDYWE